MIRKIFEKVKNIEYIKEKQKIAFFGVALIFILFISFYLLNRAYGYYVSKIKLVPSVDKALYILDAESTSFNISTKIRPASDPYEFTFSLSNYIDDDTRSEIDFDYFVEVRSTTNLPITIEIYKDESLLTGDFEYMQDIDYSWYRYYGVIDSGSMYYSSNTINYYTIKVYFSGENLSESYANMIEDIEISIKSKQIVDGAGE